MPSAIATPDDDRPPELSTEDQRLLAMALANIGEYIHNNSPHYELIEDPRNDEDYDTWEVGMEPLPGDHTWRSTSIDVSPSNGDMAE
jgi:hypothetical protein